MRAGTGAREEQRRRAQEERARAEREEQRRRDEEEERSRQQQQEQERARREREQQQHQESQWEWRRSYQRQHPRYGAHTGNDSGRQGAEEQRRREQRERDARRERERHAEAERQQQEEARRSAEEHHLNHLVDQHMGDFVANEQEYWLDWVFRTMLSYWDPAAAVSSTPALPWGVIGYINNRSPGVALRAMQSFRKGAWITVPETICHPPARPAISQFDWSPQSAPALLADSLAMVWRLFSWPQWQRTDADIATLEAILEAVLKNELPSVTPSVLAMGRIALVSHFPSGDLFCWAERSCSRGDG
ncbi:hypothetical protein DFH06DRAFT_1212670 [Mycena polygramma]|nr:hypothetical protein DFH06DRAFT_1212670 [Mycena polygramma]